MYVYALAAPSTSLTQNLNSADAYVDFIFRAHVSGSLNSLRCRVTGVTGTLPVSDIVVRVYNVDSDRMPSGTEIASGNFGGLSYGMQTCTFASPPALSAKTFYCVRIKNVNGTPASNYTGVASVSFNAESPFYCCARAYSGSGVPYLASTFGASEFAVNIGGTQYEKPVANYHSSYGGSYGYTIHSTTGAKRYLGNEFVVNEACIICGAFVGISTNGGTISRSDMMVYLLDSSNNVLASAPFTAKSATWGDYTAVMFASPASVQAGTYRLVICGAPAFGTEWNSSVPVRIMFAGDRSSPTLQYTTITRTAYGIYGVSASSAFPTWSTVTSYSFMATPIYDVVRGGLLVNPGFNGGLIQI